MNGLLLAAFSGMLLLGGCWLATGSLLVRHPRLGAAIELLDGRSRPAPEPDVARRPERLGQWLRRRWNPVIDDRVAQQLRLRGISVDRFLAYKLVGALLGLMLPSLVALVLLVTADVSPLIPGLVALLAAAAGFVVPDFVLRRSASVTSADATESLLTFIDLVTLERLANRSASQALHAAAAVSDSTVFRAIRDALERARLEQRPPFAELRQLGLDLDLPALCDIADVMKLDDSGAALSDALRARVKELRDAHLTAAKISAAAVSERMTLFMVIPSLVFGLIFLAPPLLRLLTNG